jgi:cyanate lyase
VPYRGSLPGQLPTGDGIMSAIDFETAIERQPDPKGDWVKLTLSGRFLPYQEY